MPTAEEFDEFYVATRRGLVHQTFALTGDLGASRQAVRDAYVAARHHWEKIGHLSDPESWVRPRAWSAAQRRHTVRPWHRERHVSTAQAATLEALHTLPDAQRRALVLAHLSELGDAEAARELGLPPATVAENLAIATETVATALECDPAEVGDRLDELGGAADSVKLPRPASVRRSGLRRRRNHAAIGSVAAVAIILTAGAFVAVEAPDAPPPKVPALLNTKMLLTQPQITRLSSKNPWRISSTTDNTKGTGINHRCQTSRFADDNGLGTWVRTFATGSNQPRTLVQTVELSNSPGAAARAYQTTLGWYAGCTAPRLQLIDAYTVKGIGDKAQILELRIPGSRDLSYVVGIARTGALTTSTVLETLTGSPVTPQQVSTALAAAVRNLCVSPVSGACVGAVKTVETMPPPSGETRGMLATADLPAIATVSVPWVGTDPQDATTNLAATTCDNADFAKSGAVRPVTRSYLFPRQANLPKRFGLTETIGKFTSTKAAIKFADQVIADMRACPDRELSSSITRQVVNRGSEFETTYAFWRLENQVNANEDKVIFWTGIARVGAYVAQVTMTPFQEYDVNQATFNGLIVRARDRLNEVK